jgi:hypothetical protein
MFRVRETGELQSEIEVRRRFPNTSIPKIMNQGVCDALGVDPILESPQPSPGRYFNVRKDGVVQNAQGAWTWNWVVEEMTAEQKAAIDAEQATQVRQTRDMRLQASDWTQSLDAPVDRAAWAAYRDELRSLPEQEGFPHNVVWPTKPE